MNYTEFESSILKRNNLRKVKITNSWGIYAIYKTIRKNKWFNIGRPLKEHEFYSIIRSVNNLLADEISNGREITFPHKMGGLEISKRVPGVTFVDGKLKNTYPIDWNATLRLWFEDSEAKEKKILVRAEEDFVYKVRYKKGSADYNNKCYYGFEVNRFIKKALKDNIIKGKIDTLW